MGWEGVLNIRVGVELGNPAHPQTPSPKAPLSEGWILGWRIRGGWFYAFFVGSLYTTFRALGVVYKRGVILHAFFVLSLYTTPGAQKVVYKSLGSVRLGWV